MSKSALRKELQTFSREQLVEVVLNAYDSSAKAREYFEFFLKPDADAFLDRQVEIIAKELNRTKWGTCKGRISIIRNAIKEYRNFGVDAPHVAKLIYFAFRMMLGQAYYYDLTPALHKAIPEFAAEYMRIACECEALPKALDNLRKSMTELGRKNINREIEARLAEEAASLSIRDFKI